MIIDWNKIYIVFLKVTHDEKQAREAWLYSQIQEFDL